MRNDHYYTVRIIYRTNGNQYWLRQEEAADAREGRWGRRVGRGSWGYREMLWRMMMEALNESGR